MTTEEIKALRTKATEIVWTVLGLCLQVFIGLSIINTLWTWAKEWTW